MKIVETEFISLFFFDNFVRIIRFYLNYLILIYFATFFTFKI
jgi:hypothetical protein